MRASGVRSCRAFVVIEELVLEELSGDGLDGEVAVEEVPELAAPSRTMGHQAFVL